MILFCFVLGTAPFEDCEASSQSYYWFLIVAQCLHGIGGAAVHTLAIPYMDDQIRTKNTPTYIGEPDCHLGHYVNLQQYLCTHTSIFHDSECIYM